MNERAPHLILFQKRPALWRCSECGKQFGPFVGPITPENHDEKIKEFEDNFREHVIAEHPSDE